MAPHRAQFTMVGLDVSVKLARVIGDLDVHWRQPVVVVPRFTALVHAYLRTPVTALSADRRPPTALPVFATQAPDLQYEPVSFSMSLVGIRRKRWLAELTLGEQW